MADHAVAVWLVETSVLIVPGKPVIAVPYIDLK